MLLQYIENDLYLTETDDFMLTWIALKIIKINTGTCHTSTFHCFSSREYETNVLQNQALSFQLLNLLYSDMTFQESLFPKPHSFKAGMCTCS